MEFFDNYDSIDSSDNERYPYFNGKALGIYTLELQAIDVRKSNNPKKRGSEFMVANAKVLSAEGPAALKAGETGTLYFDFHDDEYGFQQADAKKLTAALIPNPSAERIKAAFESGELPGTRFKAAIVRAPTKKGKLVTKYFFSPADATPALPAGATLEPAPEST